MKQDAMDAKHVKNKSLNKKNVIHIDPKTHKHTNQV